MTKKKSKIISLIVILLLFISAVVFVGYYCFFSTDAIKPGEPIGTYYSPNGTYELIMYKNNGGATTDYAVLGVLYDDLRHSRNIYWDYHCDSADVEWIDDDTVIINGKRIENVTKDKYDFRYSKQMTF